MSADPFQPRRELRLRVPRRRRRRRPFLERHPTLLRDLVTLLVLVGVAYLTVRRFT